MVELKRSVDELEIAAKLAHIVGGNLSLIVASYKMIDAIGALADGTGDGQLQATSDIWCSAATIYRALGHGMAKVLGRVISMDAADADMSMRNYERACISLKESIATMVAGSKFEEIVRSII